MLCLRLAAYNSGEDWGKEPLPYIAKQKKKKVQSPEIEDPEDWPEMTENICVICKKNLIYNKRTKTCSACYQQFRMGAIDHPTLGKWESSWIKHKKDDPATLKHPKVLKLYMTKSPEIIQYIVETAQKSLLSVNHIAISLLSEAIIARSGKANNL